MSCYIRLLTYTGPTTFFYDETSTGRKLTLDEVLALGLTNRNELDRHKRSYYTPKWHEINAGDQITIVRECDENDEDFTFIFIVPETGLPKPPVSLDDERRLHVYLKEHCQCVE